MAANSESKPLTLANIFHTWWPLAASWLLMSLELPAVSAVIARLLPATGRYFERRAVPGPHLVDEDH